jgi:hypothetical protein
MTQGMHNPYVKRKCLICEEFIKNCTTSLTICDDCEKNLIRYARRGRAEILLMRSQLERAESAEMNK